MFLVAEQPRITVHLPQGELCSFSILDPGGCVLSGCILCTQIDKKSSQTQARVAREPLTSEPGLLGNHLLPAPNICSIFAQRHFSLSFWWVLSFKLLLASML